MLLVHHKILRIIGPKIYFFFTYWILTLPGYSQIIGDFRGSQILEHKPSFEYDKLKDQSNKNIDNNDLDAILERAYDFYQKGDFQKAKKDLNHIIATVPEYGGTYYYRGLCYKEEWKLDSAITDFQKCIGANEFQFYGPSHLELGHIYFGIYQDFEKANEEFEIALKLMPKDPQVLYSVGQINYQVGNLNDALKYANQSVETNKNFVKGHILTLMVLIQENKIEQAFTKAKLLMVEHPKDESIQLLASILYFAKAEDKKAVQILNDLILLNPESPVAHSMLSRHYFLNNDLEQGFNSIINFLNKADFAEEKFGTNQSLDYLIMLSSSIKRISIELGTYSDYYKNMVLHIVGLVVLNEELKARTLIREVVRKKVKIPIGILMLRAALHEPLNWTKYWLNDNLEIAKQDSTIYQVYRSLGRYYHYKKQYEDAEKFFTRMLRINQKVNEGYKLRGLTRIESNQFIKAVQDFNIYLRYNKIDPEVLEKRADCKLKLGFYREAASDYQIVKELIDPMVKRSVYWNLANSKLFAKDTTGAISVFDDLIGKLKRFHVAQNDSISLSEAFNFRGLLKLTSSDLQGAIDDFTESLKGDNKNLQKILNRGIAYFRQANYELAFADFDRIIELNNKNVFAYYWRGVTKLELNDQAGAKRDLTFASNNGITEATELLDNKFKKSKSKNKR